MPPTTERCQALLRPLVAKGVTPVVTGFIGATEAGVPTTLGRGASDYSGTILGRALEADEVWIWTDVNGVMTADPRVVPGARTIPSLSYAEVGEMAYFGAKVLHPQAIRPAKQTGIPVRILNTFEPDHPGTLITKNGNGSGQTVKAITAIKGLSMVTVEGAGMIGVPGVAARTFGAVARTGTSVLMISQSSSEQSICFVVPTPEAAGVLAALQEEMARELERGEIERIWPQDDIVILAVVGAGMKGTPGISARIFGALGRPRINVIAIAQGSSEYNISLVIARGDADDAVRCIHDEFRLGGIADSYLLFANCGSRSSRNFKPVSSSTWGTYFNQRWAPVRSATSRLTPPSSARTCSTCAWRAVTRSMVRIRSLTLVSRPDPTLITWRSIPWAVAAAYHRLDHVVNVNVVARLFAVAMDDQRPFAQRLLDKLGDDRRVGRRNGLAGAIGVENAQGDRLDAPQLADGADVILGGQLAHRVGRGRVRRHVLRHRLARLLTVNGA